MLDIPSVDTHMSSTVLLKLIVSCPDVREKYMSSLGISLAYTLPWQRNDGVTFVKSTQLDASVHLVYVEVYFVAHDSSG